MSDKTNVKVMAIEKLNRLIEKFDSDEATEEAGDEFLAELDRAIDEVERVVAAHISTNLGEAGRQLSAEAARLGKAGLPFGDIVEKGDDES